jgi:GT2 family glycosyltransferase
LTKAGWKLAIASSSIVLHKVSASTGGKNAKFERYSTTSAIKFLSKHSPLGWITVCFFLVSRSLKRIASGEPKRVVNIYRGICDYLGARQSSNLFDHVAAGSRVAGQQGVQTHSESQRLRDDSSTPVAAKM